MLNSLKSAGFAGNTRGDGFSPTSQTGTVLIAEDEDDIRELLAYQLRKEGYSAILAANGRTAYEMAAEYTPDLIVLDIMMPEINGIELCEMIRKDSALEEIPIIFVTANTDDEVLARAFQVGGNDYIRKPFNKIELLTRIRAVLTHKELIEAKRVEQKLTGVMELAGAVAHELGQPLQTILTCSELLVLGSDQGERTRELVKIISEQCRRMADISKKVRKITTYSTKKYIGSTNIIDIDKATAE
ncbi:MAG: response regulator [Proteobacteria bacterium]|nr:response regulator [Pseudomonadota bacterium]MBU1714262.1 response regulator [Pseudomonadota bacterium]